MRERKLFTTVFCLVLAFGLVLGACNNGGDEGGPTVPTVSPGDVPGLPTDNSISATYVTNQSEAQTLLTALKNSGIGAGIAGDVKTLIGQKTTGTSNGYTFDFTDTTNSIKVSAKGKGSAEGKLVPLMDDGNSDLSNLQDGDSATQRQNQEVTGTLTDNKSLGSVTILKGSTGKMQSSSSFNVTLTDRLSKMSVNGTREDTYAYGWTVVSNGKAGKVILNVTCEQNLPSKQYDLADIMGGDGDDGGPFGTDIKMTYRGTLAVYGADNKTAVHTKSVATKADFDLVLAYFGVNDSND